MKLYFNKPNGPADEAIDQLIALAGDIRSTDLVREMILTALKAGQEEKEDRAGLKLMNTTLKEMRFTSKVFSPYRDVRKVTVFGSARTKPREPDYKLAQELGKRIAAEGYMVITGGGPGIMQAVNEGAGRRHSFGVNIRLPFEQRPNPVIERNPRFIVYKYFFNRKVAFLKEAHAIVLFPGGFGTLDEAMETLTLVQTGKRDPIPLVLIEEPGGTYWSRWIGFFKEHLLEQGYIEKTDFALFEVAENVEEAIEKIKRFYRRYHSLRYVDGRLVIRLSSPLEASSVEALKKRFSDILVPGGEMRITGPLEAESDEPEIAHLQRLLVDFSRRNFGRLRALIDEINAL